MLRGEPFFDEDELERLKKPRPKLLEKQAEEKLSAKEWRRLKKDVTERDGKCCRNCRRERGLDLHHVIFRSLGGRDVIENLILLCHHCHREVHGHVLKIIPKHPEYPAKVVTFERAA